MFLRRLNFRNNGITDEAAECLAKVVSYYTRLQELDLSCNNLQATSTLKPLKGINTSSMDMVNIMLPMKQWMKL